MDPDANFRERIQLAELFLAGNWWTAADRDRYNDLTRAYSDWRSNGGFVAGRELRSTLCDLDARVRANMA